MRKKVCFFTMDMKIGGVERQLYYLLNGLNKDKYEIILILCKKEGDFLGNIPPYIKIKDLSIRYLRRNKIIIAIKIFILLLEERPNIFVSFHSKLNSISVLCCKFLGIKVICCFPGYVNKGRLNFLRRLYLRFADRVIAVSKGVKNSLLTNLGVDEKNILVIENCIDSKEIQEKSKEEVSIKVLDKEKFIIVSVGRLSKEKNFEILIESAIWLPNDCVILIIGDGDNRRDLESLAERMNVNDRVVFLGSQSNPYKFMKKASLFVHSSSSEGLPTVLLEAMTLGIPCICSDYNSRTDDVIAHNATGYIYLKDNPRELAKAIKFIHGRGNCEEIRTIVENAKKHVLDYSNEKYIQKYEKVFDEY